MTGPWSFDEAHGKLVRAAVLQQGVEDLMKESYKDFAEKEMAYRQALAVRILELHANGAAWTVCQDLARGDEKVSRLRRDRDIAEGVKEATLQAAWRRSADRKDAQRFSDWSMRREMAEGWTPDAANGVDS